MNLIDGVGREESTRFLQHHDEAGGTVRGDYREQQRGEIDVGVVGDLSEEGGGVQKRSNVIKPDQDHGVLGEY